MTSRRPALRGGASRSLVVKVLGSGLGLCAQLYVARSLGLEGFGTYALTLAWLNVLSVASRVGFDNALVKLIPRLVSVGDWPGLKGAMLLAIGLPTVLAGVVAWVFVAYLAPEGVRALGGGGVHPLSVFLPVFVLAGVAQGALRGFKRAGLWELPLLVVRPVSLLVLIAIVRTRSTGFDVTAAIWCNVAATAFALCLAATWVVRSAPKALGSGPATVRARDMLSLALPLLLVSGLQLLLGQLDVIMLGALRPDEDVGPFAAATRLATLATFGLAAVNSIAAPLISELHGKGDLLGLRRLVRDAARGASVATFVFASGLTLGAPLLLRAYGPGFEQAYTPLLILLVGHVIAASVGSVGFLMTMTGHERPASLIMLVTVGVSALLNALLIPRWGAVGAAIATSSSIVLWRGSMLAYTVLRLGINPTPFSSCPIDSRTS